MALKITYHNPDFAKGMEFAVEGLVVKNGETATLSEKDERLLVSRTGKSVRELFKDSQQVKVEGSQEMTNKEVTEVKDVKEGVK